MALESIVSGNTPTEKPKENPGMRFLKDEPEILDPNKKLKELVAEGRVRQEVLPKELQTATPEVKEQAPIQFASIDGQEAVRDPGSAAPNAMAAPVSFDGLKNAYGHESAAISEGQKMADQAYQSGMQKLDTLEKETSAEQKATEMADEEMKKLDGLRAEQAKLMPEAKGYFQGKTTFQKVVAGIGLALASLTPQGAQNAIKIINSEIDRDLDMQKLAYNEKGKQIEDTKGNYKLYMDRFKDERLARMAAKADIIQRLKLDMDTQAQKTNSQVAKARLTQMSQMAELEQQKINATLYKEMHKMKKEEAKGAIPGFEGVIQDAGARKEFIKMAADAESAMGQLNTLKEINKQFAGGTLSLDARAKAAQAVAGLKGSMRLAIVGPGAVSEFEQKMLADVIADPTSFFSLKSSNKIRLDELTKALNNKLSANAKYYGLKRKSVGELL